MEHKRVIFGIGLFSTSNNNSKHLLKSMLPTITRSWQIHNYQRYFCKAPQNKISKIRLTILLKAFCGYDRVYINGKKNSSVQNIQLPKKYYRSYSLAVVAHGVYKCRQLQQRW
ncbi:MAG: hypothetical protein ABUT20_65530 [Bacteroidota bacterium]